MLRRTLAAVWFAGGIVLMIFVMRFANLPPRELLALTALLVGGLAGSFIAIVARDIPLRSWVRNTACLIGGILLAGVLYLWYHVEAEVLPAVPDANIAFRQRMEAGVELLSWLSICVAYAAFAYATLPASGGSAGAIGVKGRSVRGPGRLPAGGVTGQTLRQRRSRPETRNKRAKTKDPVSRNSRHARNSLRTLHCRVLPLRGTANR